jgi:hypothetical protein
MHGHRHGRVTTQCGIGPRTQAVRASGMVYPAPRSARVTMERMIAVVDPTSGDVVHRPSHTLTLDVPADLDRAIGIVSLDPKSQGHYIAIDGRQREYSASTSPLSGRTPGEVCLVAERNRRWTTPSTAGLYRLRAV